MSPTITTVEELPGLVGRHLGYTAWIEIDQDRVNRFADATGDHQWIHVDPARAAAGPFGGPIAHGYLTLSLLPGVLDQVLVVEPVGFAVNYGCNRVRFPSPVPVGAQLRAGVEVASAEEVAGGVQVALDVTFETKDSAKPSCVAQVVYRFYS